MTLSRLKCLLLSLLCYRVVTWSESCDAKRASFTKICFDTESESGDESDRVGVLSDVLVVVSV